MLNTAELLLKHLATYGIKSYINNPKICRFRNYHFLRAPLTEYRSETLYIIDGSIKPDSPILHGKNTNYLVFDFQYAQHKTSIDPSSNIFIITNFSVENKQMIYNSIVTCCKAIQCMDTNLFHFFNASFHKEDNLGNLLKLCSDILNSPLFLIDSNNKIIHHSPLKDVDDIISFVSYTEQELLSNNIISKDIIDSIDYVLYKNSLNKSYISTVISRDALRMYNLVCISNASGFDSMDIPLLYLLADVLSSYLSLHPFQKGVTQPELLRNFFYDLITNKISNETIISQRAEEFNIQLNKYNYLLVLFRNDKAQISKDDLLTQCTQIANNTNCITCMHADNIILLISSGTEINILGESYVGTKLKKLSKGPLNAGILSLSFNNYTEIYDTYTRCFSIINTTVNIDKGTILYYKNCLYQDSINQILYTNKKKSFSIPTAEKIIEYDEKNATEYAVSILQYLKHYMKIHDAATTLHIHKNTLVYRIRRSVELFDIDYSDYATLNALQLSLEILLYNLPEN